MERDVVSFLRFFSLVTVRVVIVGMLFCGGISPGFAAETQNDPRIKQIEDRITEESSRLQEVSNRERALSEDLAKVRRTLDTLTKEEQKLTSELTALAEQRRALQAEKEVKEQELIQLTENFRKRLRALYKSTPRQGTSLLPIPASLDQSDIDVGRYAFFLTKVHEYDRKLFDSWQRQSVEHNARIDALRRLQETQAGYVAKVSSQRQTVRDKVVEQEKLVGTLRSERTKKESIVAALRAQALRLETVVASLTGSSAMSGERRPVNNLRTKPTPKKNFSGPGLERSKGKLSYPIAGKIVRRFGERKSTLFDESVVSKGIEFSASDGAPIQAVAEGRVAYRGKMPGVGNIVILDHGERFYSLYGMLADYAVADGDIIVSGAVLGHVGASTKGGAQGLVGNFYFEIRRHGSPINPLQFFR